MNRWAGHGGRLAEARAAFGGTDWIDLSTGINPHAWPTDRVAIDWRALPEEGDLAALEATAAAHFGAAPAHVVALPGTEVGLRLLGRLLPGPARHLWPSYRTHAEMIADSGPAVSPEEDGTLILANPNNPDGRILPAEILCARIGWTIVDEAFADAHPGISVAGAVRDDGRLIVFRSFGKFFGLAGVRLGFMIAPRPLAAEMRALIGAWPVSAAAIAIGTAAYADHDWIAATRDRLHSEQALLDALLLRHGLTPQGACPLFRLVETADAAALFGRLARRAILTRPFDYNPHWLRIGLPAGEAERARLDRALADG